MYDKARYAPPQPRCRCSAATAVARNNQRHSLVATSLMCFRLVTARQVGEFKLAADGPWLRMEADQARGVDWVAGGCPAQRCRSLLLPPSCRLPPALSRCVVPHPRPNSLATQHPNAGGFPRGARHRVDLQMPHEPAGGSARPGLAAGRQGRCGGWAVEGAAVRRHCWLPLCRRTCWLVSCAKHLAPALSCAEATLTPPTATSRTGGCGAGYESSTCVAPL